jgi:ADP-heptose:LPS heptosyltransferase
MDRSLRTSASIAFPEYAPKTLDVGRISQTPALPGEPRKVLATLLLPLGDTLLTTPALHALRARFPHAQITALTYRSNAGLLEGNPDLDQLVQINPAGAGLEWARAARVLYQLRREQFDLIVNLSPLGYVLTMTSGAPAHVGFPMPRQWWLRSTRDEKFVSGHAIDRYLYAVNRVGALLPAEESARAPRLYLTGKDRKVARSILRNAGVRPGDIVITIHPGGEGFSGRKQWGLDRFVSVARHLIEQYQAKIVLVGGPTDIPLVKLIADQLPSAPVLAAGQTSLKQTAALIEASTLFIGNDSCPLHMAAAVGTPAIGIFGPSNIQHFHPVGQPGYRFVAAHRPLPCSPCFHFVGNQPPWQINLCRSRRCLQAIPAEDVIASANQLLKGAAGG